MHKKGINSVVAVVLITLISIVAASIFLGVYLKNVKQGTSSDSSSCFGIDLKVKSCFIFPRNTPLPTGVPPLNGSALLMNIERMPGGGEIKGLKFSVTDINGNIHPEDPVNITMLNFVADTNYSDLVEYNSVDAVVRDLSYTPKTVSVSAIVGSNTICPIMREPTDCTSFF